MSIKVTDPVCGMQVDPAKSKGSFEHKGTTYHFCGLRCLEKFKNDPDGILARGVPIREPAKSQCARANRSRRSSIYVPDAS